MLLMGRLAAQSYDALDAAVMPDVLPLTAILLYLTAKGVHAFWLADSPPAPGSGRG